MALDIDISHYNTGTATVAADGTEVTGQGTTWTVLRKGDLFGTHIGMPVRIAAINSDTSLTLAYPWKGPAQAAAPYEIQRTPFDIGYLAGIEALLRRWGGGNVDALAELVLAGRKLLATDPNGELGQTDLSDFMRGLLAANDAETALDGLGAMKGPAGATNNRIAVFDGETGALLKDGGSTIAELVPADGSITNPKLADVPTATVKGRSAAGAGVPTDLTMTQLLTLLAGVGNYARNNILGTVSQAGGVPTGAIVERGSNGSGEYIRFADGTQICSKIQQFSVGVNAALGSLFASIQIDSGGWPAAFASTPAAVIWSQFDDGVGNLFAVSGAAGTNLLCPRYRLVSPVSVASKAITNTVLGVGRWF